MLTDDTRAFLTRLAGREPADPALWLEALTHGSTGQARNYERLEFLGDRVLGLPSPNGCTSWARATRASCRSASMRL
jgi:hypothetical protein